MMEMRPGLQAGMPALPGVFRSRLTIFEGGTFLDKGWPILDSIAMGSISDRHKAIYNRDIT